MHKCASFSLLFLVKFWIVASVFTTPEKIFKNEIRPAKGSETVLKTYIESGIALDAALSYDLLVTIFNPSVPLHDGAVIVQNGRIAAAACFLPLTVKPRLSKELGTRHRAAIGVTEETDAVAIIVSEESGAISFAHDGEMERYLDPETLRQRLRDVFERKSPAAQRRVVIEHAERRVDT